MARDRCGICGGTRFVAAVDNHGQRYRGCDRCRVVDVSIEPLRAAIERARKASE